MIKRLLDIVLDRRGPCLEESELDPLVLYYRPLEERGRDQLYCLWAMLKQRRQTGRIDNFCQQCPHYVPMTSLDNNLGMSQDCGKGHYRFEAT